MTLALALLLLAPHLDGWQRGVWDRQAYEYCHDYTCPFQSFQVAGGEPYGNATVVWENLTTGDWEWFDIYPLDENGAGGMSTILLGRISLGDRDRISYGTVQDGIWTETGREPYAVPVEPSTWGQIKARAGQ